MIPDELTTQPRFRASKMPRVMACAGSYLLNEDRPDESGAEAGEGTVAHGYAFDRITAGKPLSDIPDLEMMRAISLYVDVCGQYASIDGLARAEDNFETDIQGLTLCGTTDFFTWSPTVLTIIDLKYGHRWVEVEENWQLITYAVLMWLKYGNNGATLPGKVRLVVVQPRANHPEGPVRSWEFNGELLRNYLNQIQNQITAAIEPGAVTLASDECRDCNTIIECHTNRGAVANAMEFSGRAAASDITGSMLAHELDTVERAAGLINHRRAALESYALESVRAGNIVPGYRAAQSYGALQWDVSDPIAAGADLGKDLARPAAPVTPTQAIAGKLITKDQAEFMASRKLGAFKLKRENLTFAKELINDAS